MQNIKDRINLLLGETLIRQAKIKALEQDTSVSELCRIILDAWNNDLFGLTTYKTKFFLPNKPGIYFVVKDNAVIYTGQSKDIKLRFNNHHRKDYFINSTIFWIEIDQSYLSEIEDYCISILSPILNGKSDYVSSDRIRTTIELNPGDKERLQKIALSLGIIQPTGPEAGKVGSVSQLMQAIAKGDIKLGKEHK